MLEENSTQRSWFGVASEHAQQRREALVAAPAGIGAVLQQKRGNLRVARTADSASGVLP